MKVRVHVRGWESDGKASMFEFADDIEAVYDEGRLLLVRDLGGARELVGQFAAGAWLFYENVKGKSS